MARWLLCGSLALTGFVGVTLLSVSAEPKPAVPPELEVVPRQGAVVSVHLGAFWKSPAGKDMLAGLTKQNPSFDKQFGVPLSTVDRVTLYWPELSEEQRTPAVFVSTTERIDWRTLSAKLGTEAGQPAQKRPTVYPVPGMGLLYPIGERGLAIVPERDLQSLLLGQLLQRGQDGPLTETLTGAGSHVLVADLSAEGLFGDEELAIANLSLKPLLALKRVRVTVDADKDATLKARLTFGDADSARKGEKTARSVLTLVQAKLAALDAKETPAEVVKLAGKISDALDGATFERTDAEVRFSATVPVELAGLQALATMDGGPLGDLSPRNKISQNNLKQLGIALHNYEGTYGSMPDNIRDKDGKALLSWRVNLLPYLEYDNVYKQLDLTKSWDVEPNKTALASVPKVFLFPGDDPKAGLTRYQMFVGEGAPFDAKGKLAASRIFSIADGTSNTIAVVEAAEGVPWFKPIDLPYDPKKPLPKLGASANAKTANAMFYDGSVRKLRLDKLKEETLRAYITYSGGEVTPPE